MGIRDGKFYGVEHFKFLDTADLFFREIKYLCKKVSSSDAELDKTSFFMGKLKTKLVLDFNEGINNVGSRFRYEFPRTTVPLSDEVWESNGCNWGKEIISPKLEKVINETPVTLGDSYKANLFESDLKFQKQLLKLIGAMRYCIIPLSISYQGSDDKWHEWYGGTGYINSTSFRWWSVKKLKIRVPDVWKTGGTECKIGVYAKNLTPEYPAPVEGTFWKTDDEYTISIAPEAAGSSELRIYGAADLINHSEIGKYFEPETSG